jgi:hypothetical protein
VLPNYAVRAVLFGDVDDPDRYLYHYTTSHAALGSILPTQRLRFGLARYMNDPREAKSWLFSLRGGKGDHDLLAINQAAADVLQRTAKLLCFARDDPERTRPGSGVEIFGRGFAHPAMWAHYAGGHSGVCLIFDRAMLHERIETEWREQSDWMLYAGNVTYRDYGSDEIDAFSLAGDRIDAVGLDIALAEHFETYHAVLFFRKNEDWSGEFEYRWLLQSPDPVPKFIAIGDSLVGVVVGEHFPAVDHDSLEHLTQALGRPPIATCLWRNGYPRINPWGSTGVSLSGVRYWIAGAKRPAPPPALKLPHPE